MRLSLLLVPYLSSPNYKSYIQLKIFHISFVFCLLVNNKEEAITDCQLWFFFPSVTYSSAREIFTRRQKIVNNSSIQNGCRVYQNMERHYVLQSSALRWSQYSFRFVSFLPQKRRLEKIKGIGQSGQMFVFRAAPSELQRAGCRKLTSVLR